MAELTDFEKERLQKAKEEEKRLASPPKRKKKKEALTPEQIAEKLREERQKVREKYLKMWGGVQKSSEVHRAKNEVAGFCSQHVPLEDPDNAFANLYAIMETPTESFWMSMLRVYWDYDMVKPEVRQYANRAVKYAEQTIQKRGPQLWHSRKKGQAGVDNTGHRISELITQQADTAVEDDGRAPPVLPGNWFDEDAKATAETIKDQTPDEAQVAAIHCYCTEFEPVVVTEDTSKKKKKDKKKDKKKPEPPPVEQRDEMEAVLAGKKSLYRIMNARLVERDGRSLKRFLPCAKLVLMGAHKMPVYDGVCYRVMTHCEKQQWQSYVALEARGRIADDGTASTPGATFAWPCFVHAFLSRSNAENFLTGPASITYRISLEIKCCEAYKFSLISDNSDEDQVVFPPGSFFEVAERTLHNELLTLRLEQRPQPYSGMLSEVA